MRGKNKKEIVGGFFTKVTKSADELLLSGQKDIDEQFEQDKLFLIEYHKKIATSTELSDKMTKTTKGKSGRSGSSSLSSGRRNNGGFRSTKGQFLCGYLEVMK